MMKSTEEDFGRHGNGLQCSNQVCMTLKIEPSRGSPI